MVLSKLDRLPPELLVEIGDYLDGCDLYYAFYGLNQRMNRTLDQQCHRLHVNFTRISKMKFDLYCNRILRHIGTRIVSLTISGNTSSTPGLLTLFLSRFNPLAHVFPKLESLKLLEFVKSDVESLVPSFSTLTQLKCLSIGEYKRLMPSMVNSDELFDEDMNLPTSLRRLAFPYEVSNRWIERSNARSFVKQLHIHLIHMNSLSFLLQRFPHLKRLTAVLADRNQNDFPIENIMPSIGPFNTLRYLNINITQQVLFDHFACFLRSVPQLHSLSLEALNPDLAFLEAHRWETVLPTNLSLFRFDLTMTLPDNPDHLELLRPFKTQFWLSRGWFVQCHLRDGGRFFRLSTVQSPIITILYWPDDEVLLDSVSIAEYWNVTHVDLWWNSSRSSQSICPNVRSIQLYGAGDDSGDPCHPNICDLLQCPSLEHIIINDDQPITSLRLASVLAKSSANVHMLTCSTQWLVMMLEDRHYEWICLLVTMRIRKLTVVSDESILSYTNLIAFCRTFINLREITMKIESTQDVRLLLNTLSQLTMANIELPNSALENVTDITQWLHENTALNDFIAQKQATAFNTCKLILWIGSRRSSNLIITQNGII